MRIQESLILANMPPPPTIQQEAEEGTKQDRGVIIFLTCLEIKHQALVGSEVPKPRIFT